MYMGYILEFSRRWERTANGNLKKRKAACSKEKVSEMMLSDKYIIWNANLCNLDEYLQNHPEEKNKIERNY